MYHNSVIYSLPYHTLGNRPDAITDKFEVEIDSNRLLRRVTTTSLCEVKLFDAGEQIIFYNQQVFEKRCFIRLLKK